MLFLFHLFLLNSRVRQLLRQPSEHQSLLVLSQLLRLLVMRAISALSHLLNYMPFGKVDLHSDFV